MNAVKFVLWRIKVIIITYICTNIALTMGLGRESRCYKPSRLLFAVQNVLKLVFDSRIFIWFLHRNSWRKIEKFGCRLTSLNNCFTLALLDATVWLQKVFYPNSSQIENKRTGAFAWKLHPRRLHNLWSLWLTNTCRDRVDKSKLIIWPG